jgi:tetratricopeptide (TPR) repeat protein
VSVDVAAGLRAAIKARAEGALEEAVRIAQGLREAAVLAGPVMAAQTSIVEGEAALELGEAEVAAELFAAAASMVDDVATADGRTVRAYARRKLAAAHLARGRYDDASGILRAELQWASQLFGAGSEQAADVHNDLGIVLKARGEYAEARSHYEAVLATGPTGEEYAAVCHNLGGIHLALGDPHTALDWARRGIATRAELGGGHKLVLDQAALAPILVALGEYDEAGQVLENVLAAHRARYGPEHYEVAVALHNLGGLLARQERYSEAYEQFQRCLEMKERVLGPRHPQLRTTLLNLAIVAELLGDSDTATRVRARVLALEHGFFS